MAAITIQSVTVQFGAQVVLEDITCELNAGETVGLVGVNGAGKTTLFRLIVGQCRPESGTVTVARGVDIGYLTQEPDISADRTLRDEVGAVFSDLLAIERTMHDVSEEMGRCDDPKRTTELMQAYDKAHSRFVHKGGHTFEARLGEILGGLGFTRQDYGLRMSQLSGGQRCRAALAKLLLEEPTMLLLDEPTNHLDIDAVRWLERFLAGHRGGAVIVSHDRYLLDRLCDRIVEVERRKVTSFPGNYSNYAQTKERRHLTEQRQFQKDQEFIQKEQAFITKHLSSQRTKEAKGRRKRLQRRIKAGEFVMDTARKTRRVDLAFHKTQTRTTTVLRCDDLTMAFGENVLFRDLSFQLHSGDRLGITGPNGVGKTTLLKIILGEFAPTGGSVQLEPKLSAGYFAQVATLVDPASTPLEEIRAAEPSLSELDARNLLGAYHFSGQDVFKPLGSLSGGEQSRVRLACLMLARPDVLILDEPTNHLDIPSREALEEALDGFEGAVIVVSHDRYLLDRIAQHLLVLRPEGWTLIAGNYSDYIERVEQDRAAEKTRQGETKAKRKRGSDGDSPATSAPSLYDHLGIDEIESLLMTCEQKLAGLNERFGDAATFKNPSALARLRSDVEAARTELRSIEEAWHNRVDNQ